MPAAADGFPLPTVFGTNRDEGTLFIYPLLESLNALPLTTPVYTELIAKFFGKTDVAPILAAYPPNDADNAPVVSQLVSDYLFFCASRAMASGGGGPTYGYFFSKLTTSFNLWSLYPPQVPQCADKVCHGSELPYVFNSATDILQSFTPSEESTSQAFADYWGAFSRPGHDPNPAGGIRPPWPPFAHAKSYVVLDTPISSAVDPEHDCALWNQVGYVLIGAEDLLPGAAGVRRR